MAFVIVVFFIVRINPPQNDDTVHYGVLLTLTTLFGIWMSGTLVSAWLYRYPNLNFNVSTLWRLFRERHSESQPTLDEQLKALQPKSLAGKKLLVMRPLGDEANMSLVVPQSMSYAQNKILGILQGFRDGFLRVTPSKTKRRSAAGGCLTSILTLIALIALLVFVSIKTGPDSAEKHAFATIYEYVFKDASTLTFFLTLIPVLLFAGLLAFFVIYGIVSLYALIGLLLTAAPFGLDAMFWNHFTSTTAEPAPVGTSDDPESETIGTGPAQIFQVASTSGSVEPGLAHSGIYINKDAIKQVVDWIKGH